MLVLTAFFFGYQEKYLMPTNAIAAGGRVLFKAPIIAQPFMKFPSICETWKSTADFKTTRFWSLSRVI